MRGGPASWDVVSLLGFSTSVLAIVSCIFTLIALSRDWRRRTSFARDVLDVHRREVNVLEHVLRECRDAIATSPMVPESILEALQMCEQRQLDLSKLMSLAVSKRESSWLSINLRLPLLEKDLKWRYEMFKEDVILLKTLCTE